METVIKNPKSPRTLVIFQPTRCYTPDLTADYSMGTATFLVKINDTEPVELEVIYADDNTLVTTTFFPGWNPDLIKLIKAAPSVTTVQVGF